MRVLLRKRANQAELSSAICTDVSLLKVCHVTFQRLINTSQCNLLFRIYCFHLGKWIILTPCMSDHRTGISSFSQERKFHILHLRGIVKERHQSYSGKRYWLSDGNSFLGSICLAQKPSLSNFKRKTRFPFLRTRPAPLRSGITGRSAKA